MITGALLVLGGIAVGWLLRSLPGRRGDLGPELVEAVCGCTHHHSMHDPETGKCNAAVAVTAYDEYGGAAGKEYASCACLRYSGPEPLPTYIATEIAGESG